MAWLFYFPRKSPCCSTGSRNADDLEEVVDVRRRPTERAEALRGQAKQVEGGRSCDPESLRSLVGCDVMDYLSRAEALRVQAKQVEGGRSCDPEPKCRRPHDTEVAPRSLVG